MASSAKPLKIQNSTPAKSNSSSSISTLKPGPAGGSPRNVEPPAKANTSDITSPHELIGFVDNLLENLDSKFDDMTAQFIDRMNQMSTDVDKLEASIQDIINSDGQLTSNIP
ncbi:hypothetical protein SCHPADRAFT_874661 [Schizopora paradoxa]|uniref:Heat shock factor binding protein 1 n=1 Tax=Schizopora paradoxa TaxID=27342 RepID=A0A0H2RN91_9AGAM|nr:hypothetical protein SCHPADRAFT_874661 [Schizopora paradoxa]